MRAVVLLLLAALLCNGSRVVGFLVPNKPRASGMAESKRKETELYEKEGAEKAKARVNNETSFRTTPHSSTIIDLGTVEEAKILFSYPNNCHEICFIAQSLEETIKHYLSSSIRRDGFVSTDIEIQEQENGHVFAKISGDAASAYAAGLRPFLDAGMLAYLGSVNLHSAGMWLYNWRFFLPLGLPMTRHRTVQLLHFPPDYVLERDQDYLSSHTTMRWAELLTENGVQSDETPRFQNIIDIAPIAAPSGDGRNLEGVYEYYSGFLRTLLRLWVRDPNGFARPIVAFGFPVRQWIKSEFGPELDVLSLTKLDLAGDLRAPTLATNHPSFIYNAAKSLCDDPNIPEEERMGVLMRIMQQDLIAARWQVTMGWDPQSDPSSVLEASKTYWGDPVNKRRIYELSRIHALNEDPEEASKRCAADFELYDRPLCGPLDAEALKRGVIDVDDRIRQRLQRFHEEFAAQSDLGRRTG
jgi:hypothetical protein